ncbi:hypothetical protein Ancab_023764 [Ancistrocladus abbreviatus]
MGNCLGISSGQPVKSKVEKYSSQDSKPVSRPSQLEGSGLENSKPVSQTAQLEDPWLESSKPMSATYRSSSEDHFQWLEGDDFSSPETIYLTHFSVVKSFEGDSQQR